MFLNQIDFSILLKFDLFVVPRLSLQNLEAGYHGLVKENETLVEVTPAIRGVGAKICGFHIVNKHHGEAPFQVRTKSSDLLMYLFSSLKITFIYIVSYRLF